MMKSFRTFGLTITLALLGPVPLLAADIPPATAAQTVITIDNFVFTPQTVTVAKGTTVVWRNRDDTPHRVVATPPGRIKSPVLDTDETYSWTATDSGTFAYFCSLHPHMTGTVIVTAN
jgi:plastocyanin